MDGSGNTVFPKICVESISPFSAGCVIGMYREMGELGVRTKAIYDEIYSV